MRRSKILPGVLLVALAAGLLAGCGGKDSYTARVRLENGEINEKSVVLSIGNTGVTYSKVRHYCYLLSCQYDKNFSHQVWDYSLGKEGTIGDQAKEEILSMVTQMAVIGRTARSKKITLTGDEKDQAVQRAEKLMEQAGEENKKKYSLSLQQMTEVLEENLLAEKMFYIATDEVGTFIPDEEALQRKVQYIRILTNGTTADGTVVNMASGEKARAKKRAERILRDLQAAHGTEDFLAVARKNTDAQKVEDTIGTVGENTGELPDTAVIVAWELKEGQMTSSVVEAEDGFYIILCADAEDEEAMHARKEELIEQSQTEMFRRKYSKWLGDDEIRISKSFWKIFDI